MTEISTAERPGNLLALGRLAGSPERRYARCELRPPGQPVVELAARVSVLSPPAVPGGEALLHLHDIDPDRLRVGDVLASPCHGKLP